MSLIGTLEQIGLVNLWQRLESYAKSGLLIIKQDAQWVELYFRDGCLMCIGPVPPNAPLGTRLLQDGFISPRALQETLLALGGAEQSEMQMALALIDRQYISQEQLRNWATKRSYEVLQALLFWSRGDVYFEENAAPSADRLLVAVAISSLLPKLTAPPTPPPPSTGSLAPLAGAARVVQTEQLSNSGPLQPRLTRASEIPNVPTLTDASQFGLETSTSSPNAPAYAANLRHGFSPPPMAAPTNNAIFAEPAAMAPAPANGGSGYVSVFEQPAAGTSLGGSFFGGDDASDDRAFVSFLEDNGSGGVASTPSGRRQPEPVMTPFVPKRIDISFMRPEMLLLPVDFSPALMQNPSVQITPEQWMVFAQVDGQTSLQRICMNLGKAPTQVCQVVGELIAESLIQLCMPDGAPVRESTRGRDMMASGMNNGYITPGYAAMPVPSWPPTTPAPDVSGFSNHNNHSFEAQSQWGNGGNGASFISGQGWIASQQAMQSSPSGALSGPYSAMYAPVGRS